MLPILLETKDVLERIKSDQVKTLVPLCTNNPVQINIKGEVECSCGYVFDFNFNIEPSSCCDDNTIAMNIANLLFEDDWRNGKCPHCNIMVVINEILEGKREGNSIKIVGSKDTLNRIEYQFKSYDNYVDRYNYHSKLAPGVVGFFFSGGEIKKFSHEKMEMEVNFEKECFVIFENK